MSITRSGIAALALATVAALSACGGQAEVTAPTSTTTSTPPRISAAANSCAAGLSIQDDGKSISMVTKGKENVSRYSYTDVLCVLGALNAPAFVTSHIGQTRALDGMQSDEWDGLKARWNYHPDNGLDITVIDQKF